MNRIKQQLLLLFFTISIAGFLHGQESDFDRSGKILVETGFDIIDLLGGSGSGFSLAFNDGETVFNASIDGGYFLTKDFAIKGQLWILSGGNSTFVTVGAGGKYYIKGVIPVELMGSLLTGEGFSEFLGRAKVGYAIRLAPNINLEPTIGGLVFDSDFVTIFGASFSMFL